MQHEETGSKAGLEQFIARFAGKLLLRKEIPLEEPLLETLQLSNYFKAVPSIEKRFSKTRCKRCNNKNKDLLARFPCKKCARAHIYCRKCIEMGRCSECEPLYMWTGPEARWPAHPDPCSWEGELTVHQRKAAQRIEEAVRNEEDELLCWAVCGAGKTEMLFPGMAAALEEGKRVCIATPRADVVRELRPRLKKAFEQITVEAQYGGSSERNGTAQLILCTTHQLLRYMEAFDMMVIDEIDAFPFHLDPSLPFAAKRARKRRCTTIYMTATPRKEHQIRIHLGTLPHVFVPLRYHGFPLPVPYPLMCYTLKKDLGVFSPPKQLMQWLGRRKSPDRQLLIFVPTIELAEKMKVPLAKSLMQMGVIASGQDLEMVHAKDMDREEKVAAFRQKRLRVLLTTTILERGVTFPSVDVVVLDAGHQVFDEAALIQISGRAGRSSEDPDGEVIFFHDGRTDAITRSISAICAMNRRIQLQ